MHIFMVISVSSNKMTLKQQLNIEKWDGDLRKTLVSFSLSDVEDKY